MRQRSNCESRAELLAVLTSCKSQIDFGNSMPHWYILRGMNSVCQVKQAVSLVGRIRASIKQQICVAIVGRGDNGSGEEQDKVKSLHGCS